MSWIGLPLESWYALQTISPSVSMSTALLDVLPPSRPITPRTTVPAASFGAQNFGTRKVSMNSVVSASCAESGGPAVSPRRARRPLVMKSRSVSRPAKRAPVSPSAMPYTAAPNAAYRSAFSGTKISSSSGTSFG